MTDTTIDLRELTHAVADIIDTVHGWGTGMTESPWLVTELIEDLAALVPDRPQPYKFRIGQWVIVTSDTTYHGLTGWITRETATGRLIVTLPGVGGKEHSGPLPVHIGYAPEDLEPNVQIPDVRIDPPIEEES